MITQQVKANFMKCVADGLKNLDMIKTDLEQKVQLC